MSLLNEGVLLTPMTDCHVFNTLRWLRDSSELRQQVDCLEVPTEDGNRAYWQSRWQDSRREDYAIVATTGNRHIGNCGLCDIDKVRHKAQLWIYLGDSNGTGAGTTAVSLLLSRGFGFLSLERIHLRVVASNLRALHFYQKIGFVEEGRFREDTIIEGMPMDAICMAMLRREFRARSERGTAR